MELHPLKKSNKYRNDFDAFFANYYESVLLSKDEKIKTKNRLLLDQETITLNQLMAYYQIIPELVFSFYWLKSGFSNISIAKKCRSDNNTDVDLQVILDGYTINFEMKTPNFGLEDDKNVLKGIIGGRIPTVEGRQAIENNLKQLFDIMLKASPQFTEAKIEPGKENKVKDALTLANNKFPDYDPKIINIVVLSLRSRDYFDYSRYLHYYYGGLFHPDSYINHTEYERVDYVVFSNIISGHQLQPEQINCWDLKEYCNIFFANPFSIREIKQVKSDIIKPCELLLDILPNDTQGFFNTLGSNDPIMEMLKIGEFTAKKYPHLWDANI